jgi:hypothetical protein
VRLLLAEGSGLDLTELAKTKRITVTLGATDKASGAIACRSLVGYLPLRMVPSQAA